MPATPQQEPRQPALDRSSTCLETDEDVLNALLANRAVRTTGATPPVGTRVAAANARPRGSAAPTAPAVKTPSSVIPYRPTLRPPVAVLTVLDDGKADGEHIRLRDNRFVIGRTEGDLVLPHDGLISARHVEITRQVIAGQQRWVITDLQSTNGLYVRVSRVVLSDESELLVGKGRYRLLAPNADPSPTSADAPADQARSTTQNWGDEGAAPAVPALAEIVGNACNHRLLLLGTEYWIGTDPSCAVCRVNDPFCEPRHARLFRDAKGGWHAEHNKSINGLWFRVPQVAAETSMHFQIGEQRFRLKIGG